MAWLALSLLPWLASWIVPDFSTAWFALALFFWPAHAIATRFGVAAMDAAAGGRFGMMVALRGTDIVEVPLVEALREPKLLDPALYETAELFFG